MRTRRSSHVRSFRYLTASLQLCTDNTRRQPTCTAPGHRLVYIQRIACNRRNARPLPTLFYTRDAQEWLFTFPLPPIPAQSIPIPSHSHSRTLHRCSISYFWAREESSLNMPLKLTISCVHFYSTETREIVVENIISFDL